MALLEVGTAAPEFALKAAGGETVRLSDFRGRTLVLYFYPKNDTAGCTMEACNFRDLAPALALADAAVVGVSPEQPAGHDMFSQKHRLNFPVLIDPRDGAGVPGVCNTYGVWVQKSLYGKKYWGVDRTTYVLNADGIIVKRWDRVRVPGHAAAVVQSLQAQSLREAPARL
jgi:peroxiredoxin Q/BCP